MSESLHFFGVVGTYASSDEEGCLACVVLQDVPVELLSAASITTAFGFEEEIVHNAFVGVCLLQIFG